jgi:hypothetical protein
VTGLRTVIRRTVRETNGELLRVDWIGDPAWSTGAERHGVEHVGISLMLSRLGVFAYAVPALSRSFLDGNQESIRILDRLRGSLGTVEIASTLLYSAGFVSFAVWRSDALPGWAGVLMAAHAPLISGPFPVVGALLALVGGGWIALSALRGTPARIAPGCLVPGDFSRHPDASGARISTPRI